MNIFDYSECNFCGKIYKGMFAQMRDGRVKCFDCNKPKKFKGIEIKTVDINEEDALEELVKDLLKKDLRRIYIPREESNNEGTSFMRDESGGIDPKVLYFQNNPIDLVTEAHDATYTAMQYLETGKAEYKEIAEDVIEKYLSMREKMFTEDEQKDIWNKIYSNEFKTLIKEVEME